MYAIAQQALKINTALFLAALVTFALFFFMTLLIRSDDNLNRIVTVVPIVDATMPDIPIEIQPPLERPEPIEEIPDVPQDVKPRSAVPNGVSIPTIDPTTFVTELPQLASFTISDSSMIPLSRATSAYPNRALQRRIEGFAIVAFTVNERGDVVDPRVLYAEPEGYFERAALQTIAKWKYAPRIENGRPVPVQDVQQRILFEIND